MSDFLVFIPFLILAAAAVGGVIAWGNLEKKWVRKFQKVARIFGIPFNFTKGCEVKGMVDGFSMRVYRHTFFERENQAVTICFSFVFNGFKGQLKVVPENFPLLESRLMGKTDLELKDDRFDSAAWVTGRNVHSVRALLNHETRDALRRLIGSCYQNMFSLQSGKLEMYQLAYTYRTAEDIAAEIRKIIRLGQLLTRGRSEVKMLRENYLDEPDTDCRAIYLESLAAVSGELPEDDEIAQDALRSPNPRLVFQAIKAMGSAGEKHMPLLFETADAPLAAKILEYVNVNKTQGAAQRAISLCEKVRDLSVRSVVVQFLASIKDQASRKFLQSELAAEKHYPEDYLKACIKALGACGTRESIAFLHSVREGMPRRDIDAAIASIQSRLGTGESGWLSIQEAKAEDGALSLDEEEET